MLERTGKGDAPRNNFSRAFRSNYDSIDWSAASPLPYCLRAKPGRGYRLRRPGEAIQHGDEYLGALVWHHCASAQSLEWYPRACGFGLLVEREWLPTRYKLPD